MKKPDGEKTYKKIIDKYDSDIEAILLNEDKPIFFLNNKNKNIISEIKKVSSPCKLLMFKRFANKVLSGEKKSLLVISDSEIVYDKCNFFSNFKSAISLGLIEGTEDSIHKKFFNLEKRLMKIDSTNIKIFENIYSAIIDASQSLLIQKEGIYSKQKETIELLHKHLVKKRILSKKDFLLAKKIVNLYKEVEHKKVKMISGTKLDKIQEDAEEYLDEVLDILEK